MSGTGGIGSAGGIESKYSQQVSDLVRAGLSEAEARLVADHRLASVPGVPVEPAFHDDGPTVIRAYDDDAAFGGHSRWLALAVALGLALISGLLVRAVLQKLSNGGVNEEAMFANFFLATIPLLGIYLGWLKRVPWRVAAWLVGIAAVLALAVNLYPLIPGYTATPNVMTGEAQAQTGILTALHLPVILWLLVGGAYAARSGIGSRVRRLGSDKGASARPGGRLGFSLPSSEGRLDFIRFTGEWVIFLILTWLAGGVILGIVLTALNIAGVEFWRWEMGLSYLITMLVPLWLFLSIWLAESTRTVVARVLQVMTWVFTPIMVLALFIIFIVFLSHGTLIHAPRDLLLLLDGVLVVVLALVLYSVAARKATERPKAFDWVQFAMIALAVVMNVFALIWMLVRLAEFGWTANRAAALGLNLLLVVNLAWTGWLLFKILRQSRRRELEPTNYADTDYDYELPTVAAIENADSATSFNKIIRWQTNYLPIYAIWAVFVVLVFPLIFTVRW